MKKLNEISNKINSIKLILVGIYLMNKTDNLSHFFGIVLVFMGLIL